MLEGGNGHTSNLGSVFDYAQENEGICSWFDARGKEDDNVT